MGTTGTITGVGSYLKTQSDSVQVIGLQPEEKSQIPGIRRYNGIELFVHFGIDTVELKGEGFKRIAEEGQQVKVGDTILEFDLAS